MRLLLALSALLFVATAQAGVTFSNQRVDCDTFWMALDGSVECHSPFFKADVTNGVQPFNIDGPLLAQRGTSAVKAQGTGICAYLGYKEYVSETLHDLSYESDPNIEAYGPFVTLNEKGEVTGLAKVGRAFVESIVCK
jgi:hypothetical protein